MALGLADRQPSAVVTRSSVRVFAEVAATGNSNAQRKTVGSDESLDLVWEPTLGASSRLVVSDRFDYRAPRSAQSNSEAVNTLRELYAGLRLSVATEVQAGRINTRQGVAQGYNPTDYFRANAVRSVASLDPEALRANRQGAFSLVGQSVWSSGALGIYALPKLARARSDSAFSIDAGATNGHGRYLVTLSQEWIPDFKPQLLLLHEVGARPQFGINTTAVVGQQTVVYFEGSGGFSSSMAASALGLPEDRRWRSRIATGLTFTTDDKLSLTAEYVYNGTGFDRKGWDALLSTGGTLALSKVLQFASATVDPPSRQNVFLHARWKDMWASNLDALAFIRFSHADHSRQLWTELRYHLATNDVGVQLERNYGAPGSVYGSTGVDTAWRVFLRHYF